MTTKDIDRTSCNITTFKDVYFVTDITYLGLKRKLYSY